MSFRSEVLGPAVRHEDSPQWVRTLIVWTSPGHYIALVVYAIIVLGLLVFVALMDLDNRD